MDSQYEEAKYVHVGRAKDRVKKRGTYDPDYSV